MENEKPKRNAYAIIPAFVRYDKDLTPNAKLLYGEITALCNETGYCWATNEYFSELYSVSETSISNWISMLIKKGYIAREFVYKEGTKEVDKRILKLSNFGGQENLNRCSKKLNGGGQENLKDNNTRRIDKEKYKKESVSTSTTFSASDLDTWFGSTYELYPRKINKVKSREAYEHKLRGLSREEAKDKANYIYLAVKKQVALWNKENDYEGRKIEHTPYFSSWLNANIEDSPHFKRRK